MGTIKAYLTLSRIYISLFAAYATATGFILAPYHRLIEVFVPAAAAFFLACGASALNQYQERNIDARMERTRGRPLPSRSISPIQALCFALAMILVALFMLTQAGGAKTVFLGLFALLWYNGIYTYLKKKSAFASVPGAAVGMIPPTIGWVSAGGPLLDPRLASVCMLFFMWQIPHFWLLLLRYVEDYKKAGLPSLADFLGPAQISRITFIWIFAASVTTLLLPLAGAIRSLIVYFSFLPLVAWLLWNTRLLVINRPALRLPELFRAINIYLLLIMALLSVEHMLIPLP